MDTSEFPYRVEAAVAGTETPVVGALHKGPLPSGAYAIAANSLIGGALPFAFCPVCKSKAPSELYPPPFGL